MTLLSPAAIRQAVRERLRDEPEKPWTRARLAEAIGCSPDAVGWQLQYWSDKGYVIAEMTVGGLYVWLWEGPKAE